MQRWMAKSLKRKLSLFLLLALSLPLVSTGFVSYQIAASITEKNAKEAGLNTLKQIKDKLEFVIQDVENMSIYLIGEKEIQFYLSNNEDDVVRYSLIIGTLTNLAFSKKYISNITITPHNGKPSLSNSTILQTELPALLEQNEAVYRNQPKWWSPLYENQTTDGLKRVVSLVRNVRNIYTFREMGRLSISLDQQELGRFLQEAGWEPRGQVLLL
ncbi:sensor histidine kinase, partial [Paenibacillus sp. HJGM_3]